MEFLDILPLLKALSDHSVDYVLVGGVAVNLHGILRDGVPIRLATPRTLYRMKRDTVRPIDQEDAARLAAAFGLEDGP